MYAKQVTDQLVGASQAHGNVFVVPAAHFYFCLRSTKIFHFEREETPRPGLVQIRKQIRRITLSEISQDQSIRFDDIHPNDLSGYHVGRDATRRRRPMAAVTTDTIA